MGESQDIKNERGWGLTIAIPLGILGASLGILFSLIDLVFPDEVYPGTSRIDLIWQMTSYGFFIVFLIGAWKRKKWGCFGLIITVLVGTILGLIGGVPPTILLVSLLGAVFLYAVYRSKEQYFE
jgi:hypothetical protein